MTTNTNKKEILLMNSYNNFNRLVEIIESVPSRKRGISIEKLEKGKNFRDVVMHCKNGMPCWRDGIGKVGIGISLLCRKCEVIAKAVKGLEEERFAE